MMYLAPKPKYSYIAFLSPNDRMTYSLYNLPTNVVFTLECNATISLKWIILRDVQASLGNNKPFAWISTIMWG